MKKSSPRNRSRADSGAAKPEAAQARELDPRADGDPQLSAALKSFEALTVGNQLHFLALVLRDEIGRRAGTGVPVIEAARADAVPELSRAAPPAVLALPAVLARSETFAPPPVLAPPRSAALAKVKIIESDAVAHHGQGNFPLPVKMSDARAPRAAAVRPASFPTLSIVMTMVCSFVLTLGVMLWRRQSDASASQNPTPLPLERPFAAAVPAATPPAWTGAREAAPAPPPPRPAPAFAAAQATQGHRDAANDLPVELSFRRRPVGNDEERPGRTGWQLTGRIHNLSNDALAVDISVESEQGPSYAQVLIEPDGDSEFGANEGVEIHPNDRITLHSAPYADIVSQVR